MHKIKENYPEFYDMFRSNSDGLFEFFEQRMTEKYYIHLNHYYVDRYECAGNLMRSSTYRLLQEEAEYIRFKLLL